MLPAAVMVPQAGAAYVAFSDVVGSVSAYPPAQAFHGADGNTAFEQASGPWDGISGMRCSSSSFILAGVFLDDSEPSDPAPPTLDFSPGAIGSDFAVLSPVLRQQFWVGDGLTGTGTGTQQRINVPPGATRMFLGFNDHHSGNPLPGWFDDNGGSLSAAVWFCSARELTNIVVSGPSSVPENSVTDYSCTANYDDGSSQDVTAEAAFSLTNSPPVAAITNYNVLVTGPVSADTTVTVRADYGGLTDTTNVLIVAVPDVRVEPHPTRWVNDGRADTSAGSGYWRHQYFGGQTSCLPFVIFSAVATNVDLYVEVASSTNHQEVAAIFSGGISLAPGSNFVEEVWEIVPSPNYGFHDVRAYVEANGQVLDTTEPGVNNLDPDAEEAWLTGEDHEIQYCRGNPVVLVHGIKGSPASFGDMETLLEEEESFACVSFDYSSMTDDKSDPFTIENIAAALAGGATSVHSVGWATEYFDRPVDIVAHSMGGLVTRAYMADMADDGASVPYADEIERLVTLGTPFWGENWVGEMGGSPLVALLGQVPEVQVEQMRLGSEFLWEFHDSAGLYADHLAVAGGAIVSGDAVVQIDSAVGPGLGGASRILDQYAHIRCDVPITISVPFFAGGVRVWIRVPISQGVAAPQGSTHLGYQLVRKYLRGEALDVGGGYAQYPGKKTYLMLRLRESDTGTELSGCHIICYPQAAGTSATYAYYPYDRGVILESGTYDVFMVPCSESTYMPRKFTLNCIGGALLRNEESFDPAVDTESPPDGLTDGFEETYFGAAHSPQTADDDPDGDGYDNAAEQALGTDPMSEDSAFGIQHTGLGAGGLGGASLRPDTFASGVVAGGELYQPKAFSVSFFAMPGVGYQLERCASLSSAWVPIGDLATGLSGPSELTDSDVLLRSAFYRISVLLP